MARNTYGLDLGSYEIKVYDKKQDTIWKEKNVLAVQDKKEMIAIESGFSKLNNSPAEALESLFASSEIQDSWTAFTRPTP